MVWWQWQWLKLHFWGKWVQVWSAICHRSPELNWRGDTAGVIQRGVSSVLTCCTPCHGLCLLPCYHNSALFTWQLRLLFPTLKKIVFCGVFSPHHILKYGYAAVTLHKFLDLKSQFYLCEILVFTGNINENHSKVLLFSWAGKTSSHSLCQSGSCNDRKLSVFSFPDIPLQWLPLYNSSWLPIYKHSFISCQSSVSAPRAWLYFPECT